MKPEEWPAVAQLLEAAYPGFADDPQTGAVYLDVLADVDSAAVERAVAELLREGREHPPPPGVIRARALGEPLPPSPSADPGQTNRDRGARRGLGWVGVLALIALGLGVAGLIVAIANNNEADSPTITRTEVSPELTVTTPPESAPSEAAPSEDTPSEPALPDLAPPEAPSTVGGP